MRESPTPDRPLAIAFLRTTAVQNAATRGVSVGICAWNREIESITAMAEPIAPPLAISRHPSAPPYPAEPLRDSRSPDRLLPGEKPATH